MSSGSYALACIPASSYPHILRFICVSVYPRILASSYPQVRVCLLVSLHPHILRFMCACLYPCILTSSYSQVHVCLLVSLHPHILISSGSCVLACILASSHPHILRFTCACLYTYILTSSYPQFICACSYPRILTSSYPQVYACLLVCSHPQVKVFSVRMNNCILASSSSLVFGNGAGQFVNNLQILRTGQTFVSGFYDTSSKMYLKQLLRADLKK